MLGSPNEGISSSHFRITFDDDDRLVLIDSSKKGTAVSYNGQAGDERRKNPHDRKQIRPRDKSNDFKWIFFSDIAQKHVIIIGPNSRDGTKYIVEFLVEVAEPTEDSSQSYKKQFTELKNAYLEQMRTAISFSLNIDSQLTTAGQTESYSPTQRPKQRPIWIDREEIGRGEFGTVYRAVDVSTGVIYAAKTFLRNGKDRRERWDREVALLRQVSHNRIVKFEDHDGERKWPRLILEYLPLGNLAEQNAVSRITEWETITILCQGLDALAYLHSRAIVHRDLKPENILIQCREPANFCIKIADFGLAKDDSYLKTCCGTYLYAAPEIWGGRPYTAKIDIWSLGVIAFQYAYQLPEAPKVHGQFDPECWYQRLAYIIDDWDSDGLLDFLSSSMLKEDPLERLSASECLRESAKLNEAIAPTQSSKTESGTPTESTSSSAVMEAFRAAEFGGGQQTTSEEVKTEIEFNNGGKGDPKMAAEAMGISYDFPTLSTLKSYWQPGECPETITQIWDPVPNKKYRSKEVERSQQRIEPDAENRSNRRRSKRQRIDKSSAEPLANSRACKETGAYIEMTLEGKTVSMRKSECWLNASQLIALAGKTAEEGKRIQRILNKNTRVEISVGRWWIPYQDGRFLCDFLQITERLVPLLQRALERGIRFDNQINYFLESKFLEVTAGTATVSIRRTDSWINATHILKAGGHNRQVAAIRFRALGKKDIVREVAALQGTYVDPQTGLDLCKEYGLSDLENILRETLEQLESRRKLPSQPISRPSINAAELPRSANQESKTNSSTGQRLPQGKIVSSPCIDELEKLSSVFYFTEAEYGSFLPPMKGSFFEPFSG